MNAVYLVRRVFQPVLSSFLFWTFGNFACGLAATIGVNVGDNFFSPSTVTINVNDTVSWSWIGFSQHSSTSNTGLWDSGIHGRGFSFSRQFTAAGSFPYFCRVHPFQTGSVTVWAANSPPSVSITNPANGAVFHAPANLSVSATASDSGGTVAQVEFFLDSVLLGTVSAPPYDLTVTNVAAGSHALTAVATDNRDGSTTSSVVTISLVKAVPIQLSASQRLPPSAFRFNHTANEGLRYVVERSVDLTSWSSIKTNLAGSGLVSFTDDGASAAPNFYRVRLLPNP